MHRFPLIIYCSKSAPAQPVCTLGPRRRLGHGSAEIVLLNAGEGDAVPRHNNWERRL